MRQTLHALTMTALLLSCNGENTKKADLEKESAEIVKVLDKMHNAENTKDTLAIVDLLDEKAMILGHNYNNRPDDVWDKGQFRKYISHWFPKVDSKPPKIIKVEARIVKILDDGKTAMAIEHFQMHAVRLMTRHVAILTKKDSAWLFSLSSYDYAPYDDQMLRIAKSIDTEGVLKDVKIEDNH